PRAAQSDAPPNIPGGADGARRTRPSTSQTPRTETRRERNRREQAERAAIFQGDAATIEIATRPDARARARAADYTSMFSVWEATGPAGRRSHIEGVISAHLAREGVPPPKVEFGDMKAGNAQFDPATWTLTLSKHDVDAA